MADARLRHMLSQAQKVVARAATASRSDLDTDEDLAAALVWRLSVIGEADARVPNSGRGEDRTGNSVHVGYGPRPRSCHRTLGSVFQSEVSAIASRSSVAMSLPTTKRYCRSSDFFSSSPWKTSSNIAMTSSAMNWTATKRGVSIG